MDVLDHLTEEHRKVEQLLARLAETEPGQERESLVEELESSLSTHMAVEEQFVYPLVESVIGDEEETEAQTEHDLARDGLTKLRELVAAPGFGAVVDMVTAGIGHHVEEEENELFPKLRSTASDQVRALGEPSLLEAKVKPKSELYEKAAEAGVDGRSTMDKDELAHAVTETSKS